MWPWIAIILLLVVAVVVFVNRDRIRRGDERRNEHELGRTDPRPDAWEDAGRK